MGKFNRNLKDEPRFVSEYEIPERKNLLDKKETDLPSPVETKIKYDSVDDYIKTFRALILYEYKENVARKSTLKRDMEIEFTSSDVYEEKGGEYRDFEAKLPVRIEELQEDVNGFCLIERTDNIKISWDDKYNPSGFDKDFDSIVGKIEDIKENIIYISFFLPFRHSPPDIEAKERIKYTIEFFPSKAVYERQMLALNSLKLYNSDSYILRSILGDIPESFKEHKFNGDLSIIELTPEQESIAKNASLNAISIIQGPPGTGKTHIIGAIVLACIQQNKKERIMINGTSNTSIENLICVVGQFLQNINKKVVWLASESRDFTSEDDLTYEQQHLLYYKMLHRDTKEGDKFRYLQHKKWENGRLSFEDNRECLRLRKKLEKQIVKESDVLICTLEMSAKSCLDELKFDTVILDEATQSTEPSSLIPLIHGASRWILVGDQKQLGPVVEEGLEKFKYDRSIFERFTNDLHFKYSFLDRQFRMNPMISYYSNTLFYKDCIKDGIEESDRCLQTDIIHNNVVFVNVRGEEKLKGTSFINEREAESLVSFARDLVADGIPEKDIGIITPYASQARHIRHLVRLTKSCQLKVGTVDSFQGSEREYILMSTVRSNMQNLGFIKNVRRLNVSVTRARRGLIMFGNKKALMNNHMYSLFINYCKRFDGGYYENMIPVKNKNKIINDVYDPTGPKIQVPQKKMGAFIITKNGNAIIDEDSPVPLYQEDCQKNLKSIISSISEEEVKIFWPDDKENMGSLKKWVDSKLYQLKTEQANIVFKIISNCILIGDVFPQKFDIFNKGDIIPQIKCNESFIIIGYNKGDDSLNLSTSLQILKPLLQNKKMTFLTYDFIHDLEIINNEGLDVRTFRFIDLQMQYKNANVTNFITTTKLKELKQAIMKLRNKDKMSLRAKNNVNDVKEVPFIPNNYLIEHKDLPPTVMISKFFLTHCADQIFFIALTATEALSRKKVGQTAKMTIQKLKSYRKTYKDFGKVWVFRQAEASREDIISAINGTISEEKDSVESLLKELNKCKQIKMLLSLGINEINKTLRVEEKDVIRIDAKIKKIEEFLEKPGNATIVKMLAHLAKNSEECDELEDEMEEIDNMF